MEFAQELESSILMIPRACHLAATGPNSKTNLSWHSKYTVIGVNAVKVNALADGMNEKVLIGECLYFSGYAYYQSDELC
ncbi:linear amide C-N hydrolase [Xenorhabdus vietnamensis]|nr:linear amide C-N hydrolase [Xenorhabdus vietnamensis]